MLVEPYVGCHERHDRAPGRDFFTSLSHEKENLSRRKQQISNEMCVFASLRSQKETFGGICDYVPTYFITEQGEYDCLLQ